MAVEDTATPLVPPTDDTGVRALIRLAVAEDLGTGGGAENRFRPGDLTVEMAIPPDLHGSGRIVARRTGVVAGTFLLAPILAEYGWNTTNKDEAGGGKRIRIDVVDGARVESGQTVARLEGPLGKILSAERVLLNFLGHCSGIATATRRAVDALAGRQQHAGICDTRKTTPGFRALDKYAVRCGGGVYHRMGLYDGVMLKDNHLAALRGRLGRNAGLAELTREIRAKLDPRMTLWLEVDTLSQFAEELRQPGRSGGGEAKGGADIVLLDNFSLEQMREAVRMRDATSSAGRPLLEASGGITLENVAAVAETGVDRIAIGALTHSAGVLDLSLELDPPPPVLHDSGGTA